jgi:enterochelin esterase-like enzyme
MRRVRLTLSLTTASFLVALCIGCGTSSSAKQGSGEATGGSGAPSTSSGAAAGSVAPSSGAASGESETGSAAAGSATGSGSGVSASGSSNSMDAGTSSGAENADASDAAPTSPEGSTSTNGSPFCNPGDAGNGSFTLTAASEATNPPEWTLQPGAKAGTLTKSANFMSPSYALNFAYQIYTSANYVSGKPAIFLVFGDGISDYLSTDTNNGGFHAENVLDNLTSSGDLPPTVALFIDPPTDGNPNDSSNLRVETYDPPTDKYPTFLMTEIIPATITGKYSISTDPDAWAIIGYSASGGQGFNVVWKLPNVFHKFIGSNASYGAANVAMYGNVDWATIIQSTTPDHVLRVSNVTCLHDLMDQRGFWLTIITNIHNTLVAKGYDARLETGPNSHFPPLDGEHDFPNSLRWMFQGCKFPSN